MLKSVVLCVLLWHEMCKFSGHAEQNLSDTSIPNLLTIVLPKINDTDMQTEPNVNYNFHATNLIFYTNGPLLGRLVFGRNLSSIDNVNGTDYVVTNGISAYKVFRSTVTWSKARQICVDVGGHLAVLRSESEMNMVLRMMIDLSVKRAWIGYHNQFQDKDWISVFDEPFDKTEWASWSNYAIIYNRCGQLKTDGGWIVDESCDSTQPFVCKIATV